jgi:phosphate starvation-inducible protein PhoH
MLEENSQLQLIKLENRRLKRERRNKQTQDNLNFKLSVIKPLTDNQRITFTNYDDGKNLLLIGSSGTGKSFLSIYLAMKEVLDTKQYEKLIIVRSVVPSKDMGFLPGPQPLDAKILTPNGWKIMSEIKIGDLVINRKGQPTKVIDINKQEKKDIYRICTTEDTYAEASLDHLWTTMTYNDKKHRNKKDNNFIGYTRSTAEILNTLNHSYVAGKNKINHFLPRNQIVNFTKQNLPISPYLLGCLLGDGSIANEISLSNVDYEIIERCKKEIEIYGYELIQSSNTINHRIRINKGKTNKKPCNIKLTNIITNNFVIVKSAQWLSKKTNSNIDTIRYYCRKKIIHNNVLYEYCDKKNHFQNYFKTKIKELGLNQTYSYNKFIPDMYKFSSVQDRIDILNGLMDTDGTVKKTTGEASFTTTSKQLSEDIMEIIRSLGGRAVSYIRDRTQKLNNGYIKGREIKSKHISYEVCVSFVNEINPFYLKRKASFYKKKYNHFIGIKNIIKMGKKICQCLVLNDEEHLYITNDYLVTHNSMKEKIKIFEVPYQQIFAELFGRGDAYEYLKHKGIVEFVSTSYLRGMNYEDVIVFVDEMQNLEKNELFAIMTRMGKNSKIIFAGDYRQSDLKQRYRDDNSKDDILDFVEVVKQITQFKVIKFEPDDIVRSGLVREFIIIAEKMGFCSN